MLLNCIVLFIGILLLIYGIKNKTRFFIIAGAALLLLVILSIGIDYKMGDGDFNNSRIPFVIDSIMK